MLLQSQSERVDWLSQRRTHSENAQTRPPCHGSSTEAGRGCMGVSRRSRRLQTRHPALRQASSLQKLFLGSVRVYRGNPDASKTDQSNAKGFSNLCVLCVHACMHVRVRKSSLIIYIALFF